MIHSYAHAVGSAGASKVAAAHRASAFAYHLNWITFTLVVLLVVGYFVFMLRGSRREFDKVVEERFGSETDAGE